MGNRKDIYTLIGIFLQYCHIVALIERNFSSCFDFSFRLYNLQEALYLEFHDQLVSWICLSTAFAAQILYAGY